MFKKMSDKQRKRTRRRVHIRKNIHGTMDRPRLTVTRSNCNLSMQVIDDDAGRTLTSVSTMEKAFATLRPTVANAAIIGEEMGKRLMAKNITKVVFDRNGYLYHGVVKSLADGARKAGVEF